MPYLVLGLWMLQGMGIMAVALHSYPSWLLPVEFWLYQVFELLFFSVRSTQMRMLLAVAIVAGCLVRVTVLSFSIGRSANLITM